MEKSILSCPTMLQIAFAKNLPYRPFEFDTKVRLSVATRFLE